MDIDHMILTDLLVSVTGIVALQVVIVVNHRDNPVFRQAVDIHLTGHIQRRGLGRCLTIDAEIPLLVFQTAVSVGVIIKNNGALWYGTTHTMALIINICHRSFCLITIGTVIIALDAGDSRRRMRQVIEWNRVYFCFICWGQTVIDVFCHLAAFSVPLVTDLEARIDYIIDGTWSMSCLNDYRRVVNSLIRKRLVLLVSENVAIFDFVCCYVFEFIITLYRTVVILDWYGTCQCQRLIARIGSLIVDRLLARIDKIISAWLVIFRHHVIIIRIYQQVKGIIIIGEIVSTLCFGQVAVSDGRIVRTAVKDCAAPKTLIGTDIAVAEVFGSICITRNISVVSTYRNNCSGDNVLRFARRSILVGRGTELTQSKVGLICCIQTIVCCCRYASFWHVVHAASGEVMIGSGNIDSIKRCLICFSY